MFNRKTLKQKARESLKKHFWLYVCLCIFAGILGTDYSETLQFIKYDSTAIETSNVNHYSELITDFVNGDLTAGQKLVNSRVKDSLDIPITIGGFELGHVKGILSILANNLFTGSFVVALFNTVVNVIRSTTYSSVISIIAAALLIYAAIIFFSSVYKLVYARIFLEGRTYASIHPSSLLFLFHVKRWIRVSLALFLRYLLLMLWFPTVIGFIVKRYSYYLVPYILAENPTLSGKEAIKLSEKMMYGHKWECFLLELSLIPISLLGMLTMGIGSILFVNPYKECINAEYYAYIRLLSHENNIENSEKLNDVYLFEIPTKEIVSSVYPDIADLPEVKAVTYSTNNPTWDFLADMFGIIKKYDDNETEYRESISNNIKIINAKNTIEGKSYPQRLCPIPEKDRKMHLEHTLYLRHYSISTLILMFFIFAFVGWLWEVSIHLVEDHLFVNRGVLHGPWLPIYGAGGLMILILLNKFRNKPAMEFLSTVFLCGVVEYITSWYLQFAHGGEKWWDYSGYIINLNGRICAEGLLIFGLGGLAAVYFAAPLLDNLLSKIKLKVAVLFSVILLSIFIADLIYSHENPNTGKGITDYAVSDTVTTIPVGESVLHTRNI